MTRPKQNLAKGGRQAMWTRLRHGPASSDELAEISGSQINSARTYMFGLRKAGYVTADVDRHTLVRNTGERAPSVNATTGTLYDWNLNPPMTGIALGAIWQRTGLSLSAFGAALGLGGNASTRLRQMIDGQRPISPAVETAANELR